MPISTTRPFTVTYSSASDIPPLVWAELKRNEWYTNTVLPFLQKSLKREKDGYPPVDGQFWITCSTPTSPPTVDLVLSCTDGPIDKYPIFIATTHAHSKLTPNFLGERLDIIADALKEVVHPSRVYSIYAPEPISLEFTRAWSKRTGISRIRQPYYASKVSYCTKDTLTKQPRLTDDDIYEARLAKPSDALGVADLCFGFASESPPFTLSDELAYKEAQVLIQRKQAWVLTVDLPDGTFGITSVVAVTRNSESVATITKVYTHPSWRGRGCAERLVRHVTKQYLQTKDVVILYVGHDNPAANVYHRVGYVGLGKDNVPVKGVDRWLEVGFDQTKVVLGHW